MRLILQLLLNLLAIVMTAVYMPSIVIAIHRGADVADRDFLSIFAALTCAGFALVAALDALQILSAFWGTIQKRRQGRAARMPTPAG